MTSASRRSSAQVRPRKSTPRPRSGLLSLQFMKFVAAGGIAAAANFFSRIGFSQFMEYVPAIVCAFFVGLMTGFILMRAFVFGGGSNPVRMQVLYYVLVNLFALIQTVAISLLLARWLLPAAGVAQYAEEVAHFFGVGIPVLTSYFGHKYWSFKR